MLIAQLSDTHITAGAEAAADLAAAIAFIDSLRPRPDVTIVSGDLTENARPEQYGQLAAILARSAGPVFVTPGNHDRRRAMRSSLPEHFYPGVTGEHIVYAVDTTPVRLIGLDTTDPGRPGGIIDATRLARLDALLERQPECPTLLFMHHPPFRTGVNLADVFGFKGLNGFKALVARHPQLRRIVAGHIHSERSATIAQALVSTGLSSTPQIVPEVFERRLVGMRPEPAGFTLHAWQHGEFTTQTYVNAGNAHFIKR